jgi:hypothetical protein
MKFTILSVLISRLSAAAAATAGQSYILPLPTVQGDATFRQVVGNGAFDGVYMMKPNGSSYEGWYFDVVADNGRQGFVFSSSVNYGSSEQTFALQFVFDNGTIRNFIGQQQKLDIRTYGDSMTVREEGNLYSWSGSPDMDRYVLRLNMPDQGIAGLIEYNSVAPAHTACGTNTFNSSLFYSPALYWKNPIPDALAKVDLTINGTKLQFTGRGYYDGAFGPQSFVTNLSFWNWGHVTLGEYSIVFASLTHLDNTISATGYIAKGGHLLDVFCDDGERIKVTSIGTGDANSVDSQSQGYEVMINSTKVGTFMLTTSSTTQTLSAPYSRWIGNAVGGLIGEESSTGVAVWELMEGDYLPPV